MKPAARIFVALESHRRTLASLIAVLLLANMFLVVQRGASGEAEATSLVAGETSSKAGASVLGTQTTRTAVTAAKRAAAAKAAARDVRKAKAGTYIAGKGTVPNGIHGNELTVVYYWKGDQTMSSQFLNGSGQEGNVDEGEAFTNLIAYINKHADDGELMGYRYNLHGWKLKPIVLDAGKGDDVIRAAEKIAAEIKPFAAVSSHGSISAYVCPRLAKAKIVNISTYDLDWGLTEKTNGMCLPQGLSWGGQVDLVMPYLKSFAKKEYAGAATPEPRKYGLLYAEYPGLVNSAPRFAKMMKDAGLPLAEVASVDPDLTTAGRQQPSVIAKFRAAGVNTIIAPDSGSLITFTHSAQASGFAPDYFVWPCSGEDSTGMVRLYNAAQWARASGLTCYDDHLNADLTNDDVSRKTEWYKAYQEADPGSEPPAPTALVYQSLLPLIAGIDYAGRDLTLERFMAGMKAVKPYRYDAIVGRTTNPANILVTIDAPDGSQVGDAAKVLWDPNASAPGQATPGRYTYPEGHRYRRGAAF